MNIATMPPKNTPLDHWSIYNPKVIPAKIEMKIGRFNIIQFLFLTSSSEISIPLTDLTDMIKNIMNRELKNTSPTWWSVKPITERDRNWPGITATINAASRPTRLLNISLPMKYTGNTTNAPNMPGKYAPTVLMSSRLGEPAPKIKAVMAIIYVHSGPKWRFWPVGYNVKVSNQILWGKFWIKFSTRRMWNTASSAANPTIPPLKTASYGSTVRIYKLMVKMNKTKTV